MSRAHDLYRALRHRWGSSLLVLILATVAVTAATVGPTYSAAGRTSIVQDTFASAPGFEQGVDTTESGPINSILPGLQAEVQGVALSGLGGAANERRLLGTPIDGMVTEVGISAPTRQLAVGWRTGTCAHLHLLSGRCPSAASQIMISPSLAAENHWRVGTRVVAPPLGTLVVTGIYAIPNVLLPYWSLSSTSFFPIEIASEIRQQAGYDEAFTTPQTLSAAPVRTQGTDTVDLQVHTAAVTDSDIDPLSRTAQRLANDAGLSAMQAVVQTGLPILATSVHSSWNTLSTPVIVITGELLVLVWLLLFLVVVDAVETRGAEVALARLRGYGRWRSVLVAVAEPVTVLLIALPLGALIGWGIASALGHNLRPGTAVPLVSTSWIAAGLATLGGVAAVLTAARRVLRRPVVDQWRRTSRGATRRGWVIDAMLLTAAAAGLVQLSAAGGFATAGSQAGSHDSVALLVPALIGVAVAVVASRLLPLACRAVFGATRRHGGLAGFLAVRQVARRPGGTRTVIVLVTAFTLATFAVGSWSIARHNRERVATTATGAATVFTVAPTSVQHLATAVDRADPGGRSATAVLGYFSGPTALLAVQPQRFAHVAAWGAAGAPQPGNLAAIAPRSPPPILLSGDAVRLQMAVKHLNAPVRLGVDVIVSRNAPPVRVDLGPLTTTSGSVTRTGSMAGCPCRLADLALSPDSTATQLQGAVAIRAMSVRDNGVWHAVPGIGQAAHWRTGGAGSTATDGAAGLTWSFSTPPTNDTLLSVADHPDPLPVVVAQTLLHGGGPLQPAGLDGSPLSVRVVQAAAAVPGAPTTGVVADLTYAELAAPDGDSAASRQVWVVPGAATRVAKSLTSQGIHILTTTSASTAEASLLRQGPGLAGSLFLLDAGAAALLAGLGAVVGLAVSARRRRYEYAALAAGGVSRRVLRRSLVIEQLLVLVAGAVIGVATGIVATIVSVRSVPEFVTRPIAPHLSYLPSNAVWVAVLTVALTTLLVVAVIASGLLLRSVRPSLLREPPA